MAQHVIYGYRPYTPAELAAAAERHRIDGPTPPHPFLDYVPAPPYEDLHTFTHNGEEWISSVRAAEMFQVSRDAFFTRLTRRRNFAVRTMSAPHGKGHKRNMRFYSLADLKLFMLRPKREQVWITPRRRRHLEAR
jgi:hypothetical protein